MSDTSRGAWGDAPASPVIQGAASARPNLPPLLIVTCAIGLILFPGSFFATFLIVAIWGGFKHCLYGNGYRRVDSPETYFTGAILSGAVVLLVAFLPLVPIRGIVLTAWRSGDGTARVFAAYLALCGMVAPFAIGLMLLLPLAKGRTTFTIRNLEDGAGYRFEYRIAGPDEVLLSIRAMHADGAAIHLGKSAELFPEHVFVSGADAEGVTIAFQADAKLLRSLRLDATRPWLNARVLFTGASDSPDSPRVRLEPIPIDQPRTTRRLRVDDLERELVGSAFERRTAPDALAGCVIEGPIDGTCFVVIPTEYRGGDARGSLPQAKAGEDRVEDRVVGATT